MEKIGEMKMTFDCYHDGVFYFDMSIQMNGVTKKIRLPRYHPLFGWIEIFGLPPQHEWVIQEKTDPFIKKATLKIDGEKISEQCEYLYDENRKNQTVILTRDNGSDKEVCTWKENYIDAPNKIVTDATFEHADGSYNCTTLKSKVAIDNLTENEKVFVNDITKKHGATEVIWKKKFTASGNLPPIYSSMFPTFDNLELDDIEGVLLEVGYPLINADADGIHGDWYKQIQFGAETFYITEGGYTSKEVLTENGPVEIKATYQSKLYR